VSQDKREEGLVRMTGDEFVEFLCIGGFLSVLLRDLITERANGVFDLERGFGIERASEAESYLLVDLTKLVQDWLT
jgi:hypothetical protein